MNALHHPYLFLLAILFGTFSLTAQTTLGPGDIAFTGYNADQPDEFSIVLLKEVVATTTITFTDDEYGNSSPNALNTGEGRLTLTFGASFLCGTEFYFLNDASGNWLVTDADGSSSNLTLTKNFGSLTLSSSGDAILAFQDNNPGTTTNPASWIAGLNMTGTVWTLGNGSSNDSQLPPALSNGTTANAITPEVDNAKYNCSTTSAVPASLAAAINTQSNWQVDDANLITLNGAGFCGFTCAASCIEPVLTDVSSSPEPVCLGATATISIAGSLNGGGAWSLRTGSCTGPVQQTSATNSFSVSPTLTTTYYVTAPNCNLTTSVCDEVTVTVSGVPADAGPDQLLPGTSTFLGANSAGAGTGTWSIISGTGGSIISPNDPTSTFIGTAGQAYVLRWTIDSGVCGTSTDDVKISFSSPSNLLLGELAFTEYVASNPDYFSVVMLADIKAGTEIHFTENGWRDPILSPPGGFSTGEGTLTATWCAAYPCGSEFKLSDTAGGVGTSWDLRDASGNVAGTVVVSGGSAFTLSTGGDQIFAYQGSVPTEGNQSNFRAAIQMNGDWDADAGGAATSAQPSIFSSNPNTSVVPNPTGTEFDNAIYNCAVTASTVSSLQTALSNPGNWTKTDTRPTDPNFCNFSCQACAEPVISGVSQNPNPVCAGQTVTINVTGSLNGATQWEVYNDSCDGTIVGSSTTNQISFTANAGGTYYVAGVDGCVATPNCTSFTLTLDGVVADVAADAIKVPQGTTTTIVSGNTPLGGATVSWTFANVGDGNGVIASPGSVSTSFSGTAGQSYVLRYTILNPGCPATSDEVLVSFLDPTDLVLGDVAFLSYSADSDDFAMVLLTDVNAGTQITLTERGWFAAGGFRPGEQTFTMEFCRAYSCGTEIDVFQIPELLILDVGGQTAATLVSGSPLALSTSGDQIFIYQGAEPTVGNQNNFLAAIHMNGPWDADATSAATSAQPSVFSDGVNSISISPEVNNARYDCSTTGPADGAALALSINDAANWNRDENIPYALPLECGISCCADATIAEVTASPNEFCSGETVTLMVTGSLNDATTWVWYEGGCAQGPSIGTGATIMVTPGAATTYFVRGEGGCVGNTGLCQSVGVTPENMPPSISCPADITAGNDAGQCTAVVNYTPPVGTDNCSGATTTQSAGLGTGATFPVGTTIETHTVTAANGQTASCSFNVTVNDTEAPSVDCAAVEGNRNNDPGFCSYTTQGNEFDPAFSDNCPGVSITNDFNNTSTLDGETFPVGTTTVNWTAMDAAGGTATCSVDVVVTDNEGPVLTCQDVTIQLGSNGIAGFNIFTSVPPALFTQSDNCGLQGGAFRTGPATFTCAQLGANPITIFKNDVNGNQTTCVITLTVDDTDFPCNQPPVADCKAPFMRSADSNCQASATVADFNDGSFDPDGDPLTLSISPSGPYPIGPTTVVLTVDDGQATAQCSTTITVFDNTAPVAPAPPADLTLQCAKDVPPPVVLTATDNCDGPVTVSPSAQITPGACLNDFVMVRTWMFTDQYGNTSSVSQTITVSDTLAPAAPAPPADLNLACAADVPAPVDLTATDNCDGSITVSPNVTLLSGGCINDFTLIRTWTFSDTCGNTSSVSQTITVLDTLAPVAPAPPADLNLECAADVPAPIDLMATDNCDGSITVSPDVTLLSGGCVNDFIMIRTWTFSDTCGNTSSVSQIITVLDTLAPVAPLPPTDLILECAADVPASVDLTATDNCDDPITVSPAEQTTPGASPNDFTLIRTWSFTDVCGNTSSASQTITVLDTTDPVVDCSAINPNRNNDSGQCSYTAQGTEFDATATDNCGVTSLANDYNNAGSLAGETFPVGSTTVTWTALDADGNSHSCSIIIVITDNEPANAVCQPASIAIDANGNATLTPSDIDGGSSDNCDVFTLSVDTNDFDCFALGDHVVTLTATDNLGQFTTCTATVTVTGPDADCDQVADLCDLCPGGDDRVDNNSDGLPDCAYFPGLQDLVDEWKCGKKKNKVTVCHIPNGDYSKRNDICVSPDDVAAHLAHGDFIGGCDNVTCDTPANLANTEEGDRYSRSAVSNHLTFGSEPRVSVYPNPTKGLLHIDLSGFTGQKMNLKLIDARGQVQLRRSIGVGDQQVELLQLDYLPSGVYWLRIETQNQVPITKRIVIQG